MFFLVIGFIAGYLFFLFYLLNTDITVIYRIVAGVFAGGGVFVFLVARMSLISLNQLQRIAEQYEDQALHDTLTGLPNRKQLFLVLDNTIAAMNQENSEFAVMVMDLNGFKEVNDTMGHSAGDLALQLIAPRLKEQLRGSDTLCRMGGDEFAVVLPRTNGHQAHQVALSLLAACSQPLDINGTPVVLGISVGIATWPIHSECGTELLQLADIAMYRAKRDGLGALEYSQDQSSLWNDQLKESLALKQAVSGQQLAVYFQPIRCDQHLHGIEALLRWPQADGEVWLPERFMRQADQLGLNQQLTEFVLDQSLQQFQRWQHQFDGCLHLNLFLGDIVSENFAELLSSRLEHFQVAPQRIMLELSEPLLYRNIEQLQSNLQALHKLGVNLSIDDFGSKGAGLLLLRHYPISEIKLDPLFAHKLADQLDSQAMTQAAQLFCQRMNIELVVEGVERQEDARLLQALGIHCYQGFAYCSPLTLSDMDQWLQSQ